MECERASAQQVRSRAPAVTLNTTVPLTKCRRADGITAMKISRIPFVPAILAATLVLGQTPSKPLATVDGETISEQQVLGAAAADLSKLDANRPQPASAYQRARLAILWKALDTIVEDKLIAAEAMKQQITTTRLLE